MANGVTPDTAQKFLARGQNWLAQQGFDAAAIAELEEIVGIHVPDPGAGTPAKSLSAEEAKELDDVLRRTWPAPTGPEAIAGADLRRPTADEIRRYMDSLYPGRYSEADYKRAVEVHVSPFPIRTPDVVAGDAEVPDDKDDPAKAEQERALQFQGVLILHLQSGAYKGREGEFWKEWKRLNIATKPRDYSWDIGGVLDPTSPDYLEKLEAANEAEAKATRLNLGLGAYDTPKDTPKVTPKYPRSSAKDQSLVRLRDLAFGEQSAREAWTRFDETLQSLANRRHSPKVAAAMGNYGELMQHAANLLQVGPEEYGGEGKQSYSDFYEYAVNKWGPNPPFTEMKEALYDAATMLRDPAVARLRKELAETDTAGKTQQEGEEVAAKAAIAAAPGSGDIKRDKIEHERLLARLTPMEKGSGYGVPEWIDMQVYQTAPDQREGLRRRLNKAYYTQQALDPETPFLVYLQSIGQLGEAGRPARPSEAPGGTGAWGAAGYDPRKPQAAGSG